MMNYIWVGLVVIAVIAGAFTGTMEGVLNNIFGYLRQAREGDCAGYDQVIPGGSEGSPGDVRDGTLDCCQHAGYR